jgi:hypothetical protein
MKNQQSDWWGWRLRECAQGACFIRDGQGELFEEVEEEGRGVAIRCAS